MLLTDVTYQQPDLFKSPLYESLSPVVFHKVNGGVSKLIKWLKDDKIILNADFGTEAEDKMAEKKKYFFLSTSRTRLGGYNLSPNQMDVFVTLDGTKLNELYKGKPVDYWGWKTWRENLYSKERDVTPDTTHQALTSWEHEDRIYHTEQEIPNAHQYIMKIDIMLPTQRKYVDPFKRTMHVGGKINDYRKELEEQNPDLLTTDEGRNSIDKKVKKYGWEVHAQMSKREAMEAEVDLSNDTHRTLLQHATELAKRRDIKVIFHKYKGSWLTGSDSFHNEQYAKREPFFANKKLMKDYHKNVENKPEWTSQIDTDYLEAFAELYKTDPADVKDHKVELSKKADELLRQIHYGGLWSNDVTTNLRNTIHNSKRSPDLINIILPVFKGLKTRKAKDVVEFLADKWTRKDDETK